MEASIPLLASEKLTKMQSEIGNILHLKAWHMK